MLGIRRGAPPRARPWQVKAFRLCGLFWGDERLFEHAIGSVRVDRHPGVRRSRRLWRLRARDGGSVASGRGRARPWAARQDLDSARSDRLGARARPTAASDRPRADCRHRNAGQARGFSARSAKHRPGSGLQHRLGPGPGRRPDHEDRLQRRPNGQAGRPSGPDRPQAVPGRARPGRRQEGAGRGQSRQREA